MKWYVLDSYFLAYRAPFHLSYNFLFSCIFSHIFRNGNELEMCKLLICSTRFLASSPTEIIIYYFYLCCVLANCDAIILVWVERTLRQMNELRRYNWISHSEFEQKQPPTINHHIVLLLQMHIARVYLFFPFFPFFFSFNNFCWIN